MLLNPVDYPFVVNIVQLKTSISNAKQELAVKRLALQAGVDPRKVWTGDKRYSRGTHDFGIKKMKRELKPLMGFYSQQIRAKKRAA